MRWNCPHCRTQLAAADEQIPPDWSFALCAQCSRFSLIRSSTPTAVKVDRAPTGESFIRASKEGPVPVIRPAQRRSLAVAEPTPVPTPLAVAVSRTEPPREKRALEPRLPEPLPEIRENQRFSFTRLAIFGCAALLAWNGYRHHAKASTTTNETLSDTIAAEAMAPQQIGVGSVIEPRSLNVLIRNNPGHQFPAIGALDPSLRYSVLDASPQADGQWYRVDAGTRTPAWVSMQDVVSVH